MRDVTCPTCGQGFYLGASTTVFPEHGDQRQQRAKGRGLEFTEAELPRCPAGLSTITPEEP